MTSKCSYLKSGSGIIKDASKCPEYFVDSYSTCFLSSSLTLYECPKEKNKGIVEPRCWNIKLLNR